jgi:hypothetical protein
LLIGEFSFVIGVVVLGWWMSARAAAFGVAELDLAWRVALPISLGLQWAWRRRYLAGPTGLGWLRVEWARAAMVVVGCIALLSVVAGPLAVAMFVTWLAGFVLTRLGHGIAVAAALVGGAVVLDAVGLPSRIVLAIIAVVSASVALVLLRRIPPGPRAPAPWGRALPAGLVGAGVMGLLVLEPSYGNGGRPVIVALTVVPSLVASMGAGWALGRLWDRLPATLASTPATIHGSAAGRVALGVLREAGGRLAGWGLTLSITVVAWSVWADAPTRTIVVLLAAHWSLALAGLLVGILEAFGRWGSALTALGSGLAVIGLIGVIGEPLTFVASRLLIGSIVAAAIALWPTVAVLSRPEHALAVTI